MGYLIPNFSYLPWYFALLLSVPIGLFIILAVFRLAMTIVSLIRNIRGIFFV